MFKAISLHRLYQYIAHTYSQKILVFIRLLEIVHENCSNCTMHTERIVLKLLLDCVCYIFSLTVPHLSVVVVVVFSPCILFLLFQCIYYSVPTLMCLLLWF